MGEGGGGGVTYGHFSTLPLIPSHRRMGKVGPTPLHAILKSSTGGPSQTALTDPLRQLADGGKKRYKSCATRSSTRSPASRSAWHSRSTATCPEEPDAPRPPKTATTPTAAKTVARERFEKGGSHVLHRNHLLTTRTPTQPRPARAPGVFFISNQMRVFLKNRQAS